MRSSVKSSLCVLLAMILAISLLPVGTARAVADPKITASAAIVMDYDTGVVIYAKDPDTLRAPASMTKVMTAYIVYEEMSKGSFTMDTPVPISDYVARISRDDVNYQMSVPLPYGGTVPVRTLLSLMLVYSASASATALAEFVSGTEEAFVKRMNETASRLGLNASYINPHGHKLNYITARSQAQLIRLFIQKYPQVLEITSLPSVNFNGKDYKTTNYLLAGEKYEYDGVDGFKTGYIRASGYCQAVTSVKNGRRLIAVAMNSSSGETRATDCVKLLDYGYGIVDEMELTGSYLDTVGHWAQAAVGELHLAGVELHTDEIMFRPNDEITRAEFVAMLYTALEISDELPGVVPGNSAVVRPFSDISDCWASSYIIRAWERGIAGGTGEGRFSPNAPITRQEIMVLLDRVLDLPDINGLNFSDTGSIAFWALDACARVTAAGIIQGSGGRLNPTGRASRAEAAQIVARVVAI